MKKENRENMKLLAMIIFSLLLAIAFYANISDAPLKNLPFFVFSFSTGVISLLIVFMAYIIPNRKIFYLAYVFSLLFILFILQMLLGGFGGLKERFLDIAYFKSTTIIIFIGDVISGYLIFKLLKK